MITFCSSVEIDVRPQDTTCLKGSRAQFMCVVKGLTDNQKVKWFRNDRIITEGTNVVQGLPSSIKIDIDDELGHYNLVIEAVKKGDNGTKYHCSVYDGNVQRATSDAALLLVTEIPSPEYNPSCKQSEKEFEENTKAHLMCTSEKGYPTVKLKWYYNGQALKTRNEQNNDIVKAETIVTINKQHKEAFFVCSLTTDANVEINENCTVGPIHVLYQPSIDIQGQEVIYEGSDGVYVCYSDASPEVKDYTWILPDTLPPEKYGYENNMQVLRLIKLTKNDNGTNIECHAKNSQGTGIGKFMVQVSGHELITNNLNQPTGSNSFNLDKKTSNSTAAMLSVVGGCLLFLASIMAFLLCSIILYTRRQASLYTSNQIPQPDVYYVPKDSIDTTSGSTYQTGKWKRSIATQVPNDLELESITYAEIEEGKKLINSYRTLKSTNLKEDSK
ncbi:uncharacterized protein [Antedon mediterranea]|uniref:uncharacterized protein n=1 Tax=Antedon mediterranea TaxID=105859 RepID=UPI003AF68684